MQQQMLKALNTTIICTTTHQDKAESLYQLGADHVIAEKGPAFVDSVLEITQGAGADVVIDFLAGNYFNSNIAALRSSGRLIMAGILDGHESHVNWIPMINKRISVLPLSLRMKSLSEKQAVTTRFLDKWWNGITYTPLHPIIHSVFPITDLDGAQKAMQANRHVGKIVVLMPGETK
jgi:NADPH:quinone reductase-like Zn-dependent oxidoreductase